MAKYVVTGGAGFIGSHMVEELLRRGESVRVADDFSSGRRENVQPGVDLVEGSIVDLDVARRAVAGCDYVIHHISYDLRTVLKELGKPFPSPLDQLREVVQAVSIPVQAVGGLTIEQAIETPKYGAPLVVLGAPLVIDAKSFRTAEGHVEAALRQICEKVHAYGDVPVGKGH